MQSLVRVMFTRGAARVGRSLSSAARVRAAPTGSSLRLPGVVPSARTALAARQFSVATVDGSDEAVAAVNDEAGGDGGGGDAATVDGAEGAGAGAAAADQGDSADSGAMPGTGTDLDTDDGGAGSDMAAADDHELLRGGGAGSGAGAGGEDGDSAADYVEDMKPSEVITELNRHIVGQLDAKRAVAIALRNRWRRQRLPERMRREIVPRNMLMIGPTGCGKTEIARRLSQLMDAPFVKVEATKFTEVGFHGRDVDTIIRDLVEQGIILTKKTRKKRLKEQVSQAVETKILEALIGKESLKGNEHMSYLTFLREGKLDDQRVDIDVPVAPGPSKGGAGAGGGVGIAIDPSALQNGSLDQIFGRFAKAMSGGGPKTVKRNLKIKEARPLLEEAEMEALLDADDVVAEAIRNVEQNGIVFIDEIDKICTPSGEARFSGDASAEGVQRDLLPLVEGSTVNTKHGNVNTDYILFICSGAFHQCKPADMLPELQGRLPIRVELNGLTEEDLYKILTEPEANLIEQHRCLLEAEGVQLDFPDTVVRRLAQLAAEVNKNVENIGARRLYTVLERVMEDYSFEAADMEPGSSIEVTLEDVEERLGDLMKQQDLQKYIL